MSCSTTTSTPSSSVESTISHLSCASTTTTAVTVSASAPNVLGNNGKHNDMKLWCNTVVAVDESESSTQESTEDSKSSAASSATSKSDLQTASKTSSSPPPLQRPQQQQQQHQKRFNRKQHSNGSSNVSGSNSRYPPTFGQCRDTTRNALAYEQLEELMRLCNHEYQSNESYYHAINALLRQIQEVRGSFTPPSSGNASRAQSADIVTPICSLPSAPINRALPHRLFRRIEVPENPTFNLIGRVLGPRGLTVRELETRFSCRIYVRGQGSIRDPEKAQKLLNKPGWEHLTEDLHILIIAGGNNKADVESRLDNASDFINRLLHPRGFDSFKRRQLVSLALLNGTFRPQHFQHFDRLEQSPHHHHNQIGVH